MVINNYTLRAEEQAVISTFRNNRELVHILTGKMSPIIIHLRLTLKNVKDYLGLSTQEMEAASDCMMGTEYITIELIYDGKQYTFVAALPEKY